MGKSTVYSLHGQDSLISGPKTYAHIGLTNTLQCPCLELQSSSWSLFSHLHGEASHSNAEELEVLTREWRHGRVLLALL